MYVLLPQTDLGMRQYFLPRHEEMVARQELHLDWSLHDGHTSFLHCCSVLLSGSDHHDLLPDDHVLAPMGQIHVQSQSERVGFHEVVRHVGGGVVVGHVEGGVDDVQKQMG